MYYSNQIMYNIKKSNKSCYNHYIPGCQKARDSSALVKSQEPVGVGEVECLGGGGGA